MSEKSSAVRMTPKFLVDHCKKHKLYVTPELNDVLYLHFQGFMKIENLEKYSGLKCLWLESNAISKIEGLENLKNLKSLFLQNNLIKKIECLENCRELDTLVLSHNMIKKLENCASNFLPVLNTLNVSHNYLKSFSDLELLKDCLNLSILDISHNQIDDILVLKALGSMPSLHVLTLTGNPVVNMIPNYRKTLILECKFLTYLDSRPVFPRDRACAEAWKRGGHAEEKNVHELWNREERRKIRRSLNATLSLRRKPNGEPVKLIPSSDEEEEEETKETEEVVDEKPKKDLKKDAMEVYEDQQRRLEAIYAQQNREIQISAKCNGDGSKVAAFFMNKDKAIDKNNNDVGDLPLADLENFEKVMGSEFYKEVDNSEENAGVLGENSEENPEELTIAKTEEGISEPKIEEDAVKSLEPDENSPEALKDPQEKLQGLINITEKMLHEHEVSKSSESQNSAEEILISKKPLIEIIGDNNYEMLKKPENLIQNLIASMSGDGDGPREEFAENPGISENKSMLKIVSQYPISILKAEEFLDIQEPKKSLIEELEDPVVSDFETSIQTVKSLELEDVGQEESLVFTVADIGCQEESGIEKTQLFVQSTSRPIETECTEQLLPVLDFKLGPVEKPSISKMQDFQTENYDSMAWFDEPTSLLFPSIQFPSILMNSQENEGQNEDPDLKKVLDLCQDQKKENMQLFFLNETEQLIQLYDEAADKNLIDRIGDADVAKVQKMCGESLEPGKSKIFHSNFLNHSNIPNLLPEKPPHNPYDFPKIEEISQPEKNANEA